MQSDDEADVLVEAAEILVAERGRVRLVDRWRPGALVQVRTCLGTIVAGRVQAAGPDLVIIQGGSGAVHALALRAVHRVSGLPSLLRAEEPGHGIALTWGSWLRECYAVQAWCLDGWQAQAQVVVVGSDHVDLAVVEDSPGGSAEHEAGIVTVPFHALVQVRAAGSGACAGCG